MHVSYSPIFGLDLSRNCSAPLTWYFATKERHHGTETTPGVSSRGGSYRPYERLEPLTGGKRSWYRVFHSEPLDPAGSAQPRETDCPI